MRGWEFRCGRTPIAPLLFGGGGVFTSTGTLPSPLVAHSEPSFCHQGIAYEMSFYGGTPLHF